MNRATLLTPAMVRELFDYDSSTGDITWRHHKQKARNGRAGHLSGAVTRPRWATGVAYRQVGIRLPGAAEQRIWVGAHRLAWAHATGEWPPGQIDHIDGNGLNNALANLRLADASLNARNRHLLASNSSGVAGVVWHKQARKWQAAAGFKCPTTNRRRSCHLGLHESLLDAAAARKSYELRHGYGPAAGTVLSMRTAA